MPLKLRQELAKERGLGDYNKLKLIVGFIAKKIREQRKQQELNVASISSKVGLENGQRMTTFRT